MHRPITSWRNERTLDAIRVASFIAKGLTLIEQQHPLYRPPLSPGGSRFYDSFGNMKESPLSAGRTLAFHDSSTKASDRSRRDLAIPVPCSDAGPARGCPSNSPTPRRTVYPAINETRPRFERWAHRVCTVSCTRMPGVKMYRKETALRTPHVFMAHEPGQSGEGDRKRRSVWTRQRIRARSFNQPVNHRTIRATSPQRLEHLTLL